MSAHLFRGIPNLEVEEKPVLAAAVFVPDTGEKLATLIGGAPAFDPGDDGEPRIFTAEGESASSLGR
jgi:hypothetical protein